MSAHRRIPAPCSVVACSETCPNSHPMPLDTSGIRQIAVACIWLVRSKRSCHCLSLSFRCLSELEVWQDQLCMYLSILSLGQRRQFAVAHLSLEYGSVIASLKILRFTYSRNPLHISQHLFQTDEATRGARPCLRESAKLIDRHCS